MKAYRECPSVLLRCCRHWPWGPYRGRKPGFTHEPPVATKLCSRMLSPIGRNALFCCLRYDVQLQNIAFIKKFVVRGYVRYSQSPGVIHTARCLLELLYVKHGYSSPSLFSRDELVYAISYLSTV